MAFLEDHGTAHGSVLHPLSTEDQAAMRAIVEPNKGRLQATAARVPFDAIMERVTAPASVDGWRILRILTGRQSRLAYLSADFSPSLPLAK
jgi:hypothetical protein